MKNFGLSSNKTFVYEVQYKIKPQQNNNTKARRYTKTINQEKSFYNKEWNHI